MGNIEKEDEALVRILVYSGGNIPLNYQNVIKLRWVRSYRKANGYMKIVHPPAYYFAYNGYVTNLLKRHNVMAMIAVLDDDEDVVLGFSVTEKNVLHYVHVPKPYRRQRIATMLMPNNIEWFTHLTDLGLRLWSLKLPNAKFSPFL
jgi:hypothetical protein